VDCKKCPIAEECGLSEKEKKMCPLVALIREWRRRTLKKITEAAASRFLPWKVAPALPPWKEREASE